MRYNLVGQTFEKWTVLSFSHTEKGKRHFLCRCACGQEKTVEVYSLVHGKSKSCRKCSAKAIGEWMSTHGKSNTRTYRMWSSIKTRCFNEKHSSYRYAGAVGVGMFAEWIDDFEAFYKCVGDPPVESYVLGRIDQFKDYAPGNIAWITPSQQIKNSRSVARMLARKAREAENNDV